MSSAPMTDTPDIAELRAAFEARKPESWTAQYKDGEYADYSTQMAWEATLWAHQRRDSEIAELVEALNRCLPIVESDAQMMAAMTRHAPLGPETQAVHDSTEYESERLIRELPALIAKHRRA